MNAAPARYAAGLSRPFFVSRSALEDRAKREGFRNFAWHERKSSSPPIDPHGDPKYSDDWEEWVTAEYKGRARVVVVPARPAWIVRIDAPTPAAIDAPTPAPSSSSSGRVLGALAAVAGVVVVALLARGRR